jgi:DNA polymerase III alpha subunit
VVTCGLVVEQRTHHQITGEPMKFLTLADWTGMVETELFTQTYKSYGLATVRYPVLEVTATVELVRERARLFVACAAGGETAHEIRSQAIAASSDCRASLVTRQQP